jgi:zinc-binding alcohol dehydrogenase/oxidoreductase
MGNVEEYREIVQVLGHGYLRPTIDSVYQLDNAVEAFGRLKSGEQMGKVVIEM